MNRRTAALILVLSLTALNAKCSKSDALANADQVIASLKATTPLITQFAPGAAGKLTRGIVIAEKLKAAVASTDAQGAVSLLSDLIPVFQSIVNEDIPAIANPSTRVQILSALALADIGLHFLVRVYVQQTGTGATRASDPGGLRAFDQQEVWGSRFRR